ncbi:guanitoxin biosynthesis L-enduracididine beta-hydroxylase GntD [Dactylosporangium sp. NPDC000555]|uniref:guanitoxin biosynthesis L-enduracididine beta-hydroxylase GntD n=1 Tax=Dactylosporangium sp. NPDC000555 TaxID=3154260 RepID=UPI00331E94C9
MTTESLHQRTETHRTGAQLDRPVEYNLDEDEVAQLTALAERLRGKYGDPTGSEFYDLAWSVSELLLPPRLRMFLESFRRTEHSAACVVRGFPIRDEVVGPTPGHWRAAIEGDTARIQELFLALSGMTLGEPFGWATLQDGRLIQNVLPIRGDEERQSGYGSESLLEFHTEDGFHPNRCDYLLLMGLRNNDQVPTIIASVRDLRLDERDRTVLSEDRFCILPDTEHIRQLEMCHPDHPALLKMRRMLSDPTPTAVLFGDRPNPYLRIDRPFMRCLPGDVEAETTLDRFMAELERVQQDVVVEPGMLLIVDNYVAAHGRRSFQARYDGTDRWLKKLTVSRNLRRGLGGYHPDQRRVLM